jgi:hypothetical protein
VPGHGFREVCSNEAGRNDRHAQFIAGLLPQTLGDRAHGELRAGVTAMVGLMTIPAVEAVLTKHQHTQNIHETFYGCLAKIKARRDAIVFRTRNLDLPFVSYNGELLV